VKVYKVMAVIYQFLFTIAFLAITTQFFGCVATKPTIESTFSPSFQAGSYDKVAIVVDADDALIRQQIEDAFAYTLIAKGYHVPSRTDIGELSRELRFQHTGVTDANASEIGKMLNVPGIFLVTIPEGNGKLSARFLDVAKGEVLWIGSNAVGGMLDYSSLAYRFANAFPSIADTILQEQPPFKEKGEPTIYSEGYTSSHQLFVSAPTRIAVVVRNPKASEIPKRQIEDECMSVLMEKGYTVPSRSDMSTVLAESRFQQTGSTDSTLLEAAKILNVQAILVVYQNMFDRSQRYIEQQNEYLYWWYRGIGARLLDVQSGEILWVSWIMSSRNTTRDGLTRAEEDQFYLDIATKVVSVLPQIGLR
jgi:hypothetical protein